MATRSRSDEQPEGGRRRRRDGPLNQDRIRALRHAAAVKIAKDRARARAGGEAVPPLCDGERISFENERIAVAGLRAR